MLPRASRLTRKDFSALIAGGRVRHFPLFSIRTAPFGGKKAAVVVSKKEAPLAVSRVRMRRKVYTALRGLLPLVPKNTALAVFPRKGSFVLSPAELSHALREALKSLFPTQ